VISKYHKKNETPKKALVHKRTIAQPLSAKYRMSKLMKITPVLVLLIVLLCSCDRSKWETIKGSGIDNEPKSIGDAIYFENENHGVVGGYRWTEVDKSEDIDGLARVPVLYHTKDGGMNWRAIKFNFIINNGVDDVYLSQDSIICRIDTTIFISLDSGINWSLADPLLRTYYQNKYVKHNPFQIENRDFLFNKKKYRIKESYVFEGTQVIVCYGDKSLTNYYFASKDSGESWTYLQEEHGSNKRKFLLNGEYLFAYEPPFGLQKLKLYTSRYPHPYATYTTAKHNPSQYKIDTDLWFTK
jgi:hypothetical protein